MTDRDIKKLEDKLETSLNQALCLIESLDCVLLSSECKAAVEHNDFARAKEFLERKNKALWVAIRLSETLRGMKS